MLTGDLSINVQKKGDYLYYLSQTSLASKTDRYRYGRTRAFIYVLQQVSNCNNQTCTTQNY